MKGITGREARLIEKHFGLPKNFIRDRIPVFNEYGVTFVEIVLRCQKGVDSAWYPMKDLATILDPALPGNRTSGSSACSSSWRG